MAIVASGQVAFSDIQTEFGGTNPIALSEYYSGGLGPAAVPSSGEIQVSDFHGTSAVLNSVTVSPAHKYEIKNSGPPFFTSVEHIMHGFGQTYLVTHGTTMGTYDGVMTNSLRSSSHQGSVTGSANWGTTNDGVMGTLRALTHHTVFPNATSSAVSMIVSNTGSNSNSGFTNLTITRSGMTTLTLSRTDANYVYSSTDSGTRIWIWLHGDGSPDLSNYLTGIPSSNTTDSSIFPGGPGSGDTTYSGSDKPTFTLS